VSTFKAVAQEWTEKNEREGLAPITLSKIEWLLSFAYPTIGNRPIAQITPIETLAVLRDGQLPFESRDLDDARAFALAVGGHPLDDVAVVW
jgi:hypothetical protein